MFFLNLIYCQLYSSTWNVDANGNWNVNGNWISPAIFPNGEDEEAIFGNVITSNRSITLGEDIVIGRMEIEDNNNYIFNGNTLFFSVSAGNAEIFIDNNAGTANGSHRINSALQLEDTTDITQGSTGTFTITGNIVGSGGLTLTAPNSTNTLNLNANNNSYSGGTTINSGTLRYTGQACITPFSTVQIGNGAAPDAILLVDRGMGSSSQFLASLSSDGILRQGPNRITRVSGIVGSGTFEFNSINGNLIGVLDGAGDTTFAGAITGGRFQVGNEPNAGSRFLKSGSSTLTLSGNSSYISRTFIGAGSIIRAESNTALGSSDNRSSVLVFSGGVLELSNGISLDKRILLNGSGISNGGSLRNVSGSNENSGIVEIGWSASSVSSADATISVDSDTLTLSGSVQGSNNLTKIGAGTLTYSGLVSNTLSGSTTISEGTLRLNKTLTNALNGPLFVDAGQVIYDQPDQIEDTVTVTLQGGELNMNGQDDVLGSLQFFSGNLIQNGATLGVASTGTALTMRNVSIPGNIAFTSLSGGEFFFDTTNGGSANIFGDVDLGGVSRNFIVPSTSSTDQLIIHGSISNGGIIKSGNGRLLLLGGNNYGGNTQIDNGSCIINGSLGDTAITVTSGALLGGNGLIGTGSSVLNNSGIVSPGNSIDTLTIDGDYTQNQNGIFLIEILNPTTFDQLIVNSGVVNLDGTLQVEILSPASLRGTNEFIIIDNTLGTGVSGEFSQIIIGSPFFEATATYNANTVVLSLEKLENFINDNLPRYPNLTAINFQTIDQAQTFLSERFLEITRRLYCKKQKYCISPCKSMNRLHYSLPVFNLYAGPKGQLSSSYTKGRQARSSTDGLGFIIGGEALLQKYAVGINFIYEKLNTEITKNWGSITTNRYSSNFYQTFLLYDKCHQALTFNNSLGFAMHYQNMKRITFGEELLSDLSGYDIYTTGDCIYIYQFSQVAFSLFGGWRYYHTFEDSYQERGMEMTRLQFDSQKSDSLRSRLGVGWFREIARDYLTFTPYVSLEWQREYMDRNRKVSVSNEISGQSTKLSMHRSGRDYYLFSFATELSGVSSLTAKFSYDFQWNNSRTANYLYFTIAYRY